MTPATPTNSYRGPVDPKDGRALSEAAICQQSDVVASTNRGPADRHQLSNEIRRAEAVGRGDGKNVLSSYLRYDQKAELVPLSNRAAAACSAVPTGLWKHQRSLQAGHGGPEPGRARTFERT